MAGAPGIEGGMGAHEDLSVGIQRLAINECANMGSTGWAWEKQEPCHRLGIFGAGNVGGRSWNSAYPGLRNFVSLFEPSDWMGISDGVVLKALADTLIV